LSTYNLRKYANFYCNILFSVLKSWAGGEINFMDNTELILNLVKSKYKNIRKFSEATGIPYSTIKSGLKRGVGGMAVETVIKMCDALSISAEELFGTENIFISKEIWREELHGKIENLNEQGCKILSAYADGLLTNREYLTESLGEVKNHA
jgi:hypothetical protein